jgi:hypothetical protein
MVSREAGGDCVVGRLLATTAAAADREATGANGGTAVAVAVSGLIGLRRGDPEREADDTVNCPRPG